MRSRPVSLAQRLWSSLVRNKAGSMATMFGLAMPGLLGFVGLGVEMGTWYQTKRYVQTASDAAAISGAFERARCNTSTLVAVSKKDAGRNGFTGTAPDTITIHNPPTTGPNAGKTEAVEAVLTRQQALLFSALFLSNGVTITARSVAMVQITGQACVLALDSTASKAVDVQGSTIVDAQGCVIAANSNNSAAINISGSSTLQADSLWTVGNITNGGSNNTTLAKPPTTNAWELVDPNAGLTVTAPSHCDSTDTKFNNVTKTISPGVYCNGIDFGAKANITLNPGTYYIDKGDITVNAQATISCNCSGAGDGVTFVLTSSGATSDIGTVTINGGATIDIKAPTGNTYTYPGLLFFQDRRAGSSGSNKINGGSGMNLAGDIYFPSQPVQFSGDNKTSLHHCTQIIARTVTFIGNSTIDNSGCKDAGIEPVHVTGVALVE
ncbi:MAG: hypothetical protein HY246_03440 [Proteobacteria bacterium]|nr:hypothetical protein [Pseudomonadota bacterium]